MLPKSEICTERRDVYPTGISVKVGASYWGDMAVCLVLLVFNQIFRTRLQKFVLFKLNLLVLVKAVAGP